MILIFIAVLFQKYHTKEVLDYPWECGVIPECALVLFVHVEKTGGTTLRQLFTSQSHWSTAPWEYLGYRGGHRALRELDQILSAAQNNVPHFLAEYGPRHFFEVHGMQADFLPVIRRLKALTQNSSSEFVQRGCVGLSMSNFRDPKKFYLSNLHETFGHSIYLRRFREHIAPIYKSIKYPRAIYFEMGWRQQHPFEEWYQELIDLEVRSLAGRYLSSPQESRTKIFEKMDQHHVPEEMYQRAVQFLNELDFVGITERYTETMLGIQNLVGVKHIHGIYAYSNNKAKEFAKQNNFLEEEEKYMALVANMSHLDQALFKQATTLFEKQILKIPNFEEKFRALRQDVQTKKYVSIQDGAYSVC